jgi:hypothetical protein
MHSHVYDVQYRLKIDIPSLVNCDGPVNRIWLKRADNRRLTSRGSVTSLASSRFRHKNHWNVVEARQWHGTRLDIYRHGKPTHLVYAYAYQYINWTLRSTGQRPFFHPPLTQDLPSCIDVVHFPTSSRPWTTQLTTMTASLCNSMAATCFQRLRR